MNSRIVGLHELLPTIDLLLKCGEDQASLSITPYSPGVSRPGYETLTLTKYVTAPGAHGLRCQFPSHFYSAGSFAPQRRHSPTSGWPQLAKFIEAHRIRMSELKSETGTHWSESYHLIQLDFGTDCQAASDFATYFFEEMLLLRLHTFTYKLRVTGS